MMQTTMTANEYIKYRSAIQLANDTKDKAALAQIQKQLVVQYGLHNQDVLRLLKMFRFSV